MFLGEAADYRNQKVLMLPAELGAKMPLQRVKQPFLVASYQAVGLLPGIRQFLDQIASQISGCPCDQRRAFFYRNARNCSRYLGSLGISMPSEVAFFSSSGSACLLQSLSICSLRVG